MEPFEIISEITEIDTIAVDNEIDEVNCENSTVKAAGENSKELL